MARLIRLDRTGHTTVAEWTDDDAPAREAAVERLPPGARLGNAGERPAAPTAAPTWCGSSRWTPTW